MLRKNGENISWASELTSSYMWSVTACWKMNLLNLHLKKRAKYIKWIINECLCVCMLSCFGFVQLFATLWTVAHRAPLSMGFSRQEYWNGLFCPPPGDLPDSGIEPAPPALTGGFFTISTTCKAQCVVSWVQSFWLYGL